MQREEVTLAAFADEEGLTVLNALNRLISGKVKGRKTYSGWRVIKDSSFKCEQEHIDKMKQRREQRGLSK